MSQKFLSEYCPTEKSRQKLSGLLRRHGRFHESVNRNFLKNLVPLRQIAATLVEDLDLHDQVCVHPVAAEVVQNAGHDLFIRAQFALCDAADGCKLVVTHHQYNPSAMLDDGCGRAVMARGDLRKAFRGIICTEIVQNKAASVRGGGFGAGAKISSDLQPDLRPLQALDVIHGFLVESLAKPYLPG